MSKFKKKSNLFLIFENGGQILIFFENGYIQLKGQERLKKTYEVKFCLMQKEISYIRLKKRLPIRSLKIDLPIPPILANICQNEKKNFVGNTIK